MAVNLSPVGGVAAQFFTNTGAVLTGGKLFTYAAGTTTPQATYTSSNGATAWTNPIVLDAAGRVSGSGEIWLTDGVIYKFVLKDSNDVLIATYDNITGINSNSVSYTNAQEIVTATAGQTVFNLGISYQPGTNSLSVFVDGVNQYGPGAQYSYVETDSNTVTFNAGLHVGAEVKFTTTQQQGAGAVDASQVAYDPPFTGSVATNVGAQLAQTVSVKDFGAVGDGVVDDTAAIQAAINSLTNYAGPGKLIFPRGTYRITTTLTFQIAWVWNEIDFQGSTIVYDGPTSVNQSIFAITKNYFFDNVFLNGTFNANNKAGFVFYIVGEANLYAIKANKIENCELQNPTVACVQLGNITGTGHDMDGADWIFSKVYFRHNGTSLGIVVDADNIFNTQFHHCWFNGTSGGGTHAKLLNGSGHYFYDAFFGYLANSSDFCIDLHNGNLGVFGANTEEGSILQTQSMIAERKNIYLANIMVNQGTASVTPEYAIYAPVGQLTIESCTFGKAEIFPRNIYAGDSLTTNNVYLGSNAAGTVYGTYSVDFPDRCSIEGQYLNNVNVINGNNNFALWSGSGSNDYPFGYQSSGYGTFTVTQSNSYTAQGQYCALVAISNGYATGNNIDGLQAVVPFNSNQYNGSRNILAVVKGFAIGLTGTTTVKLQVKFIDAVGNTYGANSVTVTPDVADGAFTAIISATPSGVAGPTHVAATIGTGVAGAAANIYVTAFYMFPIYPFTVNGGTHYKSYVDAWTKYPKQLDGFAEYAKAGQLVGGSGTTVQRIDWGAAAPTSGTWNRGDVVFNSSATSGGAAGWMCVASGSPGTWKAMANLA